MKRTDAEFWQILDFTFLEGGPYSRDDVEQARFVAVINATTRRRFFGPGAAVGQTIEAFDQRFRVVGVVEDVSELRRIPFGDIWVPYTTTRSNVYRTQLIGTFNAIALASNRAALPGIREEFNVRLKRVEIPDPKINEALMAPFETPFERFARDIATSIEGFDARNNPAFEGSQAWKVHAGLRRRRVPVRPAPDGQPDQHQPQPHHGARLGDRRSQGRSAHRREPSSRSSSSKTCCSR